MTELQPLLLYKLIPHLHYKTQIEVHVLNMEKLTYQGQASKIYDWFAFSVYNTAHVIQIGISIDDTLVITIRGY